MSDTPRTDKAARFQLINELGEAFAVVPAKFTEELERENAELRNALELIASDRFGTGGKTGLKAHEIAMAALEAAKGEKE
jgi:hypothetical protein